MPPTPPGPPKPRPATFTLSADGQSVRVAIGPTVLNVPASAILADIDGSAYGRAQLLGEVAILVAENYATPPASITPDLISFLNNHEFHWPL